MSPDLLRTLKIKSDSHASCCGFLLCFFRNLVRVSILGNTQITNSMTDGLTEALAFRKNTDVLAKKHFFKTVGPVAHEANRYSGEVRQGWSGWHLRGTGARAGPRLPLHRCGQRSSTIWGIARASTNGDPPESVLPTSAKLHPPKVASAPERHGVGFPMPPHDVTCQAMRRLKRFAPRSEISLPCHPSRAL